MKQNISIEQLNQLTIEQKEKLRSWWTPVKGELVCDSQYNYNKDHSDIWEEKDDVLPLLSIGQMIEFLIDSKASFGPIDYFEPDICDSLWEAVKEQLK